MAKHSKHRETARYPRVQPNLKQLQEELAAQHQTLHTRDPIMGVGRKPEDASRDLVKYLANLFVGHGLGYRQSVRADGRIQEALMLLPPQFVIDWCTAGVGPNRRAKDFVVAAGLDEGPAASGLRLPVVSGFGKKLKYLSNGLVAAHMRLVVKQADEDGRAAPEYLQLQNERSCAAATAGLAESEIDRKIGINFGLPVGWAVGSSTDLSRQLPQLEVATNDLLAAVGGAILVSHVQMIDPADIRPAVT